MPPGYGEGSKATQFQEGNRASEGFQNAGRNAGQWQPGQSGNPGGYAKGTVKLATRLQVLLSIEDEEEATDYLAKCPPHAREQLVALLDRAKGLTMHDKKGLDGESVYSVPPDATAQKHLWDRHDGPVATKIELTNVDVFGAIAQAMQTLGYSEADYDAVSLLAVQILDPNADPSGS